MNLFYGWFSNKPVDPEILENASFIKKEKNGFLNFKKIIMIYILTSFFDNLEWLEIQERFLNKNLKFDYNRIGFIESDENIQNYSINNLEIYENKKINKDKRGNNGGVKEQNDHFNKLDKLKDYTLSFAKDGDIIIFMDSDCFPIRKIDEGFFTPLEIHDSISMRRHKRKRNVHGSLEPIKPIFSVFYSKTLKDKNLNWAQDWPKGFNNLNNYELRETGGPCYKGLEICIYGDKLYHHGMGSRYENNKLVNKNEDMLKLIRRDDEFYKKINENERKNKTN